MVYGLSLNFANIQKNVKHILVSKGHFFKAGLIIPILFFLGLRIPLPYFYEIRSLKITGARYGRSVLIVCSLGK